MKGLAKSAAPRGGGLFCDPQMEAVQPPQAIGVCKTTELLANQAHAAQQSSRCKKRADENPYLLMLLITQEKVWGKDYLGRELVPSFHISGVTGKIILHGLIMS